MSNLDSQGSSEEPSTPQNDQGLSMAFNDSGMEGAFFCDICHAFLKKEDQVAFECGHNYHLSCIKDDIIYQIDADSFPVMCPIKDCEQEPSMFLLSLLLSREKFQACIGFEQSLCPEIKENNCFNCHQRFLSDAEVDFHKCLKCKKMNCLKCHGQYHHNQPCPQYRRPSRKQSDQNSIKVPSLSPPSLKISLNTNKASQLKNFTEGEQVSTLDFAFEELKSKNQSAVLKPYDINSMEAIRIPKLQKILPNIPDKKFRNKPGVTLQHPSVYLQQHQQQRPSGRVNSTFAKLFSKAYQSNILNLESQAHSGLGSYSPSPILSPLVGHRSLNVSISPTSNERNTSLSRMHNPEKQMSAKAPLSVDKYHTPRRAFIALKQQQVLSQLQMNSQNGSQNKIRAQKSTDLSLQHISLYEPEVAAPTTKRSLLHNQSPSHSLDVNKYFPRKPQQQLSSRF